MYTVFDTTFYSNILTKPTLHLKFKMINGCVFVEKETREELWTTTVNKVLFSTCLHRKVSIFSYCPPISIFTDHL